MQTGNGGEAVCMLYVHVVQCSGFPCEDPPSADVWSVPVTANNSKHCSCATGFQQCPPGLYNVVHVLTHVLDSLSLRIGDATRA